MIGLSRASSAQEADLAIDDSSVGLGVGMRCGAMVTRGVARGPAWQKAAGSVRLGDFRFPGKTLSSVEVATVLDGWLFGIGVRVDCNPRKSKCRVSEWEVIEGRGDFDLRML